MELVSIQYLRALAALSVVLWHASRSLLPHEQFLIALPAFTAGVDVFFVISGFIMYYTTASRQFSPGQFYIRRLVRIVPTYFVFTTLAFLIAKVSPHSSRNVTPYVWDYVRSLLFIPYYNMHLNSSVPLVRPEVGQGWTLDYEIFFYAIFGACLVFSKALRVGSVVLICVTLTIIGAIVHPPGAILKTYTDPLLLEFIFGVLLGYFSELLLPPYLAAVEKRKSLVVLGLFCTVLAIAALVAQNQHFWANSRPIAFGLPALSLVIGFLLLERSGLMPKRLWLLNLGNASYGLYLMHTFILGGLRRAWQMKFSVHNVGSHVVFCR